MTEQQQLIYQFMVGVTPEGKIILGLPAPITEHDDRARLLGYIDMAAATARALPLQAKQPVLAIPDGQPLPDLTKLPRR